MSQSSTRCSPRSSRQLLGPARKRDEPVTPRHEAIAASLQVVFEEAAFHVLNGLHARTNETHLCLAGGCAMNSVANGKIRAHTPFKEVYIQPASGDNGTALGAAYCVWNQVLQQPRGFVMNHGYWGPQFEAAAINAASFGPRARISTRRVAKSVRSPMRPP